MKYVSVIVGAAVSFAAIAGGSSAFAQGFGVYEQSTCAMGRGGAGVAAPCNDGSAVFFNPAGLPTDSARISLGGVVIGPRGDFVNASTNTVSKINPHWYPVPNIYVSKPLSKKVVVGVGVFAPYGLTADWPDSSEGRFLGYRSLVQGVYTQPTVSVKLSDRLSVGAGLDLTFVNLQLRQRVDLSVQPLTAPGLPAGATFAMLGVKPGSDFADINLKGQAWHKGYHLGLIANLSPRFSVGARYMSEQKVEVKDGTITTRQIATTYTMPVALPGIPAGTPLDALLAASFGTGGTLSNQSTSASIPLPRQFVAGIAIKATPTAQIFVDFQFSGWKVFDTLPIDGQYLKKSVVESYRDTKGIRIGAEFAAGKANVIRVGFDGHSAAAPDQTVTPNLPEGKRQEYSAGFGSHVSKRVRFDLAYLYLHQPARAGRSTDGGHAVPTTADNNGTYHFKGHLFGASLTWGF
jgi:long-chain fatty acid transport protein